MILIPNNKYQQYLTSWLFSRLNMPFDTEQDKRAITFLARLSKAQMKERNRGDEYPFIGNIQIEEELFSVLQTYTQSENIQIRAYCKDVLSRHIKGKEKFKFAIAASDDYLRLYEYLPSSPWFLLRAISVRSYKATKELDFVGKICEILRKRIHTGWIVELCKELKKSYSTNELLELSLLLQEKAKIITYPSHRADERFYFDAMYIIGCISKTDSYYMKALSYECEVDYINTNKEPNTIYPNNVDIIQNAYNEIYEVKKDFPEDFNRIEQKLLKEKHSFQDFLQLHGVKVSYSIPKRFKRIADKMIKSAEIENVIDIITFLKSVPFITKDCIDNLCQDNAHQSPILSMFGSKQIGNNGLTQGTANPEDTIRINIYRYLRLELKYIVQNTLTIKIQEFNENEIEQVLCDYCQASYISTSQVSLWSKGLVCGLKKDYITAVHILSPQIERALVNKAESIYGDLSALYRDKHQDAAGLNKVLDKLKPYFKEDLYNDLKYFLIMGADVNLRNCVAHGLWNKSQFDEHGPYLLWLALKMFFCEDDIFIESSSE